jgi:hypothetical protein
MKGLVAFCIFLSLTLPATAVENGQVLYVGGTVPALTAALVGRLDTTSETSMTFEYPSNKLVIPYATRILPILDRSHSSLRGIAGNGGGTPQETGAPAFLPPFLSRCRARGAGYRFRSSKTYAAHASGGTGGSRSADMPAAFSVCWPELNSVWHSRKCHKRLTLCRDPALGCAHMRNIKNISPLLALPLLASMALAQARDWQAVKDLQTGAKISVRGASPFHNLCIFESATDEQLICEHILRGPRGAFVPRERVYERKRIREVRLEHSDAANIATGAAIGGGIGAALGASAGNGTLTRGGGALLLGTGGAIVGGLFGRDFPVVHGKVIYRR